MSTSLDAKYDTILVAHHRGNPSITELAELIGVSRAAAHARLKTLEDEGLLEAPPTKGQARSRTLTQFGISYLRANGLIPTDIFQNDDFPG
jgi:DNA-binding IclR family transcriptional regulator